MRVIIHWKRGGSSDISKIDSLRWVDYYLKLNGLTLKDVVKIEFP